MHKKILLFLPLFFLAATPASSDSQPDEWPPTSELVAHVDALALKYELPREFGEVSTYARYYWGIVDHGHKTVRGALITSQIRKTDSGQVHIVDERHAPVFADGGCMFVYLEYDVAADKITKIRCNFELPVPPPPPPK